jgi:uncharacterized protein
MTLQDRITAAQKEAMKARDPARLSALRLITAAIQDREIALRTTGGEVTDAEVLALLGKMVKQRQESAKVYAEGGRPELAGREIAEIRVIEDFLPRQLSAAEVAGAIDAAVAATGAAGLKDMGRVMAELKARYTGQMDFGAVGPQVKTRLAG